MKLINYYSNSIGGGKPVIYHSIKTGLRSVLFYINYQLQPNGSMTKIQPAAILKLFFFCIRPPLGLYPALGPLERYMMPTLDSALLFSSRG